MFCNSLFLNLWFGYWGFSCLLVWWDADVSQVNVKWWQRSLLMASSNGLSYVLLLRESDTAVIIHFVCGAKEVWIAPSQKSLLWKHCQAMLSAHFVGMAVWQTSGKGRTEEDRNCQAHVYWQKYVCVWVHPQNIDNISFQRAEPVVTVCQSLNFMHWCLCLASLNFISFPSRLSCLHLGAFVSSVMASSCLLKAAFVVFFHTHLHFSYHIMVRLDYLGLKTLSALIGKGH